MSAPIRALIFDFDGLLVDTEASAYLSWQRLFRELGAELPRAKYQLDIGTSGQFDAIAEIEAQTGRRLDWDELWAQRMALRAEISAAQPLMTGVLTLLDAARAAGLPLAVASSSDHAWVSGWLERHRISDYFQCVRTRDDVARIKPAPDLFLSAAAGLGVDPASCLVFEDSPNGMRAALAAGMRCVAVPTELTSDLVQPPVTLTLASLAALPLADILVQAERGAVPAVTVQVGDDPAA